MTAQPKPKASHNALNVEPYRKQTRATFFRRALPAVTPNQIKALQELQLGFDAAFPPVKSDDHDVLIVSWAEIERQFLDLCAPWDQESSYTEIERARLTARHESPEKTLRTLFVLNNIRSNLDTPEPDWGTGENYPMP